MHRPGHQLEAAWRCVEFPAITDHDLTGLDLLAPRCSIRSYPRLLLRLAGLKNRRVAKDSLMPVDGEWHTADRFRCCVPAPRCSETPSSRIARRAGTPEYMPIRGVRRPVSNNTRNSRRTATRARLFEALHHCQALVLASEPGSRPVAAGLAGEPGAEWCSAQRFGAPIAIMGRTRRSRHPRRLRQMPSGSSAPLRRLRGNPALRVSKLGEQQYPSGNNSNDSVRPPRCAVGQHVSLYVVYHGPQS